MFSRAGNALRMIAVLSAAILVVAGCGDDSKAPLSPSQAKPAAVLGATGAMTHVQHPLGDMMRWDPPADSEFGDVQEYVVYQYDPRPDTNASYQEVDRVPGSTVMFNDLIVGQVYMYRVRAVNVDGVEGDWSDVYSFIAEGARSASNGGPRPGIEIGTPDEYGGDDPLSNP